MFFNEQGAWRSFRAPLTGSKKQFRSNLEDHITQTMHALGGAPPAEVQVNGAFSSNFKSAFKSILPDDVRQTITRIADDALAAGKIPALDIYFQGTAEWIPWELLHDGKGYLGLRFAVARHPIVQERMDLGVPRNRPVKKVCSYLGKEVLQDGVLDGWKGTFAGFSATAGWEKRFPPADGAEFPSLDQLDQALDAELIHVTCHGGKKDENCDDSPDVHAMPPETEEHNAAGAFTPNASADKLARMGKEKIVVYEKPT